MEPLLAFLFFGFMAIVLLVIAAKTIRIVPQATVMLVERLGKFDYLGNSRGLGGMGGSLSSFSPVCDNTSLIAPTLDSIAEVSTGIKITFELLVRVMSRRLSM